MWRDAALILGSGIALSGCCGWMRCAQAAEGRREQVVQLAVNGRSFEPSAVGVRKGDPVKLLVTRKTDRTWATDMVIKDRESRSRFRSTSPSRSHSFQRRVDSSSTVASWRWWAG